MFSASRAVGSPLPVKWEGRMQLLHPMTVGGIGTVEMFLLDRRRSAVDRLARAAAGIPPELLLKLHREARRLDDGDVHYVTHEEFWEFFDTAEGLAMWLWLMFRGAVEYGDALAVLRAASRADLRMWRVRALAVSSLDAKASRDWYDPGAAKASEGDTEAPNWRLLVNRILNCFLGVLPPDVAGLTMYQLQIVVRDEANIKGAKMSRAEFVRRYHAGAFADQPWARGN